MLFNSKKSILSLSLMLLLATLKAQNIAPTLSYNYPLWLNEAAFYQIYPQSFKDSDGDGIGDIKGMTEKLPYVKSIGVNTIWLNPVFASSFRDAGYDVDDYYKVDARYGNNDDLKNYIEQAHTLGLRVCLDLVAGHTSKNNKWFKESAKNTSNEFSDRYIWTNSRDVKPKDFVINYESREGNYLKNFFDTQPALNYGYANPDPSKPWEQLPTAPGPVATREALKDIISYWMNMGADGFRVDMASSLIKNDPTFVETYKLWGNIRTWFSAKYPQGVLLAEWSNPEQAMNAGFMMDFMIHFNAKGYPSLFFEDKNVVLKGNQIPFFSKQGGTITEFLTSYLYQKKQVGTKGLIALPTSNHDFQRLKSGTRDSDDQIRVALAFLLTWPGVPYIYYGDEIGMKYISTQLPDKEGSVIPSNFVPYYANRAGTRTPMQWDASSNAGFSTAEASKLYLPQDPDLLNRPTVAKAEKDTLSLLHFTRKLLKLRQSNKALNNTGDLEILLGLNKIYPLIYKRTDGVDSYVIMVNPKNNAVHVQLKEKLTLSPIMEQGINIDATVKTRQIFMDGVSFGIYKVVPDKK
ncbi:MAG: alpha-amylase [Sphingobacteriales bacterium]|nr:MAG: alpha-amylase [Sphingobacteriales bacterium]